MSWGGTVLAMINTLKTNRMMIRDRGVFKHRKEIDPLKTSRKLHRARFSKEETQTAIRRLRKIQKTEKRKKIIVTAILMVIFLVLAYLTNERYFF